MLKTIVTKEEYKALRGSLEGAAKADNSKDKRARAARAILLVWAKEEISSRHESKSTKQVKNLHSLVSETSISAIPPILVQFYLERYLMEALKNCSSNESSDPTSRIISYKTFLDLKNEINEDLSLGWKYWPTGEVEIEVCFSLVLSFIIILPSPFYILFRVKTFRFQKKKKEKKRSMRKAREPKGEARDPLSKSQHQPPRNN